MNAKDDLPRTNPSGRARRLLRRNPLRTRAQVCHELFAVLVLLLAFALPAAGVMAGLAQVGYEESRQHTAAQRLHPVAAVLRQDVYTTGTAVAATTEVKAAVAWTASDGTRHTGRALVRASGRTGDTTTIWLDTEGRPAAPPPSHGRLVVDGVGIGIATVVCGVGILAVLYGTESVLYMRVRKAAWARDWTRTAPRWTRTG